MEKLGRCHAVACTCAIKEAAFGSHACVSAEYRVDDKTTEGEAVENCKTSCKEHCQKLSPGVEIESHCTAHNHPDACEGVEVACLGLEHLDQEEEDDGNMFGR